MNEEHIDEELLRREVDEELRNERAQRKSSRMYARTRLIGLIVLICSAIGWLAALEILMGKLFLLENPGEKLGCDVNPFISCGTIMMTWQASAFGIPNMAIGLGGFAVMGVLGALMLSKNAVLPRWINYAMLGGSFFAFAFVHFLSISAIFFINALCPYCIVVWAVVALLFFSVLAHTIENRGWHKRWRILGILRHWIVLTVVWYVLVFVVIVVKFFDQWMLMLG